MVIKSINKPIELIKKDVITRGEVDLFKKLNELITKHHKVEWCVIEGGIQLKSIMISFVKCTTGISFICTISSKI